MVCRMLTKKIVISSSITVFNLLKEMAMSRNMLHKAFMPETQLVDCNNLLLSTAFLILQLICRFLHPR